MAGAHIDKVTSSRHRSVGETGGSQHSQDKREESSPDKRVRQDFVQDCNFCGRSHERKKTSCPAWGKVCRKCNGRSHFQSKCRKVHAVSMEAFDKESDMEPQFLSAVASHNVGNSHHTALTSVACVFSWTVQLMGTQFVQNL